LGVFGNKKGGNAVSHAPPTANLNRRRRFNDRQPIEASSTSPDDTTSIATIITGKNPVIRSYRKWMGLPQIIRFGVAGNLGNIGFFFLEKVIFQQLSYLLAKSSSPSAFLEGIEKYQDGLSFFSAYLIQIVTTHLLYAFLVYGLDTINTYEKYSKTLWGQFKVYGVGLFGATALNSFLITRGGLNKTWAFWTTTATFAVFNYFLISMVVKNAVESSSPSPSSSNDADPRENTPVRQRRRLASR